MSNAEAELSFHRCAPKCVFTMRCIVCVSYDCFWFDLTWLCFCFVFLTTLHLIIVLWLGTAIPGGGRPGDWLCPNPSCNDHNYGSRETCRKCGGAKTQESMQSFLKITGQGGKHPGDWNCASCCHLNFASRTECRLCNTAKPPQQGTL